MGGQEYDRGYRRTPTKNTDARWIQCLPFMSYRPRPIKNQYPAYKVLRRSLVGVTQNKGRQTKQACFTQLVIGRISSATPETMIRGVICPKTPIPRPFVSFFALHIKVIGRVFFARMEQGGSPGSIQRYGSPTPFFRQPQLIPHILVTFLVYPSGLQYVLHGAMLFLPRHSAKKTNQGK